MAIRYYIKRIAPVHRSTWICAGTLQKLDEVSMYVPENVYDLSDDVIVGRTILNLLKLQFTGRFLGVL